MIKRTTRALVATLLLGVATSTAIAQAKWWWEKYPTATDKSLSLQGATGGSVTAKQNPTGANGSVAGNTATQPPTVIIQQTASATPNSQLTCVQTATPAAGGASYGTTISVCPNIIGYMATPIIGGGYSTSYVANYSNNTTIVNNPILACCYVPVSGVTSGGAAYSPWSANQAFNSNGFSGNQKQEFLTPGTFNWTVPGGVYRVWASVVGGGGGGGAGAWSYWSGSTAYPGAGGGRGGTGYRRPIDVIPGSTVSIRVGAGGAGGVGSQGGLAGYSGWPGGTSYVTVNGYTVEAQGGFGASGGYEGNGFYPSQPPSPTLFAMSDGRGSCNNSTCTGSGGHFGYLAIGSGTGLPGSPDGSSGRGSSMGGTYGEGNSYNPTGAGKNGATYYGGGGGGAGFIGMPYSTAVPSAANGTTGTGGSYAATGGFGGYGYGAGGGGGNGGGMSSSSIGNGGNGAPGAVWIEW